MDSWRPWREAMRDALYGDAGFYRASGVPGRHFRTAAHASPQWADALLALATRVDHDLEQPADFTVVDLGAGGGELLAHLAELSPRGWRLVGVDVAPRPAGLPVRVEWRAALPEAFDGLLLAVEWLDVVPVDVVERTEDGLRLIEVAANGAERLAGAAPRAEADWLERWWPLAEAHDRAEVGRTRDEAWSAAVGHVQRGVALAVDYAAVPARDVAGTLTGYRGGRQVLPVPDGSCDITAHVLMESCAAAVSAGDSTLTTQREALRQLGLSAARPAYSGEASAYLESLSRVGDAAELLDESGLGGFAWLLHAKQTALPL
jgi:SAM-dependent MidA family methyltransferase